eukprot:TRINITY_DN13982_c0_g1_i1.p1 TRINITY_DN13982_c0_g1~~TRINITY_DN13982_c0_g1_i1.p1  ORF type:complete len:163 (+),score=57.11 TRINITY_DN13982_c0_g1_i1:47-490(+)
MAAQQLRDQEKIKEMQRRLAEAEFALAEKTALCAEQAAAVLTLETQAASAKKAQESLAFLGKVCGVSLHRDDSDTFFTFSIENRHTRQSLKFCVDERESNEFEYVPIEVSVGEKDVSDYLTDPQGIIFPSEESGLFFSRLFSLVHET